MPKGYWIAHVTVTDAGAYPKYVDAARPAFMKYKAKFLARGGRYAQVEGEDRSRNVVIEFERFEDALACYHSAEYQAAKAIRLQVSTGAIVIVEGA